MADVDVFVEVKYDDAGNFPNTKRYLLLDQTADDGSEMGAVMTAVAALVTDLDVLTWDHIDYVDVIVRLPQSGAAANVASNNSVQAFHRTTDTVTGKPAHFIVPAWDDAVFDKLPNGALSDVYNAAAEQVSAKLRNPDTGNTWNYVAAQNRSSKRGQRQYKP